MHKTLYVDVDEEITSIIDRIRLEEAAEIFLVVPKQAMLTQGVINLKLLKKEIEKIGKSVMIATSDVHARKVIERLGIKIKEMTSDLKRSAEHNNEEMHEQQTAESELSRQASNEAMEKIEERKGVVEKRGMDIGSSSFFDGSAEDADEILDTEMGQLEPNEGAAGFSDISSIEEKVSKQSSKEPNIFDQDDLRRDLYAKKLTRESHQMAQHPKQPVENPEKSFVQKKSVSNILFGGRESKKQQPLQPAFVPQSQFGMPAGQSRQSLDSHQRAQFVQSSSQQAQVHQKEKNAENFQQQNNKKVSIQSQDPQVKNLFGGMEQQSYNINPSTGLRFGANKVANEKASNFFSGKKRTIEPGAESLEAEKKRVRKEVAKEQKAGKPSFFWRLAVPVLIIAFALGGFGFWAFRNYPKVTVAVYPKQKELSKEIKIIADDVSGIDFDGNRVPGKLVELEVEKSMNFDATGEAFESDDGKSRGKVKIYNYFSSSAQPLVKTTRVLSKEGKLFRLVSDVTVPGMNGEEPGVVEVGVIADKAGTDYNISATTFTIEGFKGNPKYEKFEVRSDESMANGGEPDPNKKMTVVSAEDLDNARVKTVEAFESSLEEGIAEKLENGQRAMVDSVEKEMVSASASHVADEVASQFSYTVKQKIKAIVFNAQDINDIAFDVLEDEAEEGYSIDGSTEITFKKGISDFEAKTLTMYINAHAIAWPQLDQAAIAGGIAGKKEDEIKTFLSNYPEIEKVEISVVPSWLTTASVPAEKIKIEERR